MNRRFFLSWLSAAPIALHPATRAALSISPIATKGSDVALAEMSAAITRSLSCGMTVADWGGKQVWFPSLGAMSAVRRQLALIDAPTAVGAA